MSTVTEANKVPQPNAGITPKYASPNTFEGKVVSLTGNTLVMANREGKEFSHTLAADARLTCDGTACKAEELKAGRKVRVTTAKDDRNIATGVESLDKNAEFAQRS